MSNGILPVQSTRPTLREWLLTRLFSDRGISQEFYNRLMNLCNYDYPMSPALRGYVESTFGFELIGIIEQYSERDKPVLSGGMRNTFRRIIPDEFFLEFVRIFDCDCCPPIIQEVSDITLAVDGTATGQLTVERYIEASGDQHIHLYEWDGASWVQLIDSSSRYHDPDGFIDFEFNGTIVPFNWECSLDEGVTWQGEGNTTIDPPVSTITVWFRNTINGCVYTNLPIIPLTYCTDWAVIDGGNNFFFFGSVNGVTPPDQAGILATMTNPYQGVQGAFGGVVYNGGSNTIYLQVSRPEGSPVTASLATILDENGQPVSAVPTNTTCVQNCYSTSWTPVSPVSTIVLRGLNINGVDINLGATTLHVDEVGLPDEIIAIMETDYGIYDPQLSIIIFCSGNTVTMQVLSTLDFQTVTWQNDTNTESGVENLTPC